MENVKECPSCEYHKQRAQLWRDEVYRLAGHPRGKPALGDLNPESLETVEIDLPEPIGYVSEGSAERLATNKQAHEQIRRFRLFTHDVPLYRHPQRTWVGLTQEELCEIVGLSTNDSDWNVFKVQEWLRKVEDKLRSKNT